MRFFWVYFRWQTDSFRLLLFFRDDRKKGISVPQLDRNLVRKKKSQGEMGFGMFYGVHLGGLFIYITHAYVIGQLSIFGDFHHWKSWCVFSNLSSQST